ncbi:MAG: hypothetical protein NTU98_08350 [Bacteroidetes bacterium]|nr:hypothetical protein [Bacteroidota bacterium]
MNILVLEDDGSIAASIKGNFEPKHTVYPAFSIYDAMEIMETQNIYLYIIDLNIDPDGLNPEEQNETNGSLFTGWIFIKNRLLNEFPELQSEHRIIIYSDYLEPFRKAIDKKLYENISLYDKTNDPADLFIKEVKELLDKAK